MDPIERLSQIFERFPGIGPRQAGRFVQFLLRSSPAARRDLSDAIQKLGGSVHQCTSCMRWHAGTRAVAAVGHVCSICANPGRDQSMLAIVAGDADLDAIEKSGTYRGQYFVLGGTISLASEDAKGLRIKQLLSRINDLRNRYRGFREIILAFPANPEGDATAERVREEVMKWQGRPLADDREGASLPPLSITTLGRGLSTGSELEYADPETLKNALDNRK